MKQLLFMTTLTFAGAIGALIHPFYGVLLYYTFAVLRPQYLWKWALPGEVRWSLLAAGAAIFGTLLALPRVMRHGRWNVVSMLMILFGALLLLSCLDAINSDIAARWGVEYAKIFVMVGIATLTIHRLAHLRWLAVMILLCLGYIAWEINSLYLFNSRLDIYHYGYGGLDNNGAALMLAMGLPFAYAFGRMARQPAVKFACFFVAVLLIHAVLMSYSRGGMVAALVGVGWLLWHHRPRWQVAPFLAVSAAVVLVLAGAEIREEFLSIQRYQEDGSAQSRFDSWDAAWRMAWDHPLTGVGIRNANLLSHNYGADQMGRTIHSQFLQIAADSGIPALLAYAGVCLTALWRLGRVRRLYSSDPEDDDETPELARLEGESRSHFEIAHLALAIQGALVIFLFGGLFLSLEVFELPWLLFTMAGLLPSLAHAHCASAAQDADEEDDDAEEPEEAAGLADLRIHDWPSRPTPRPV